MREVFDRYPSAKYLYENKFNKLRKKYDKKFGSICKGCGEDTGIPLLHHKDCNPSNNGLENINGLCHSCHRYLHAKWPNWRRLDDGEVNQIIIQGYKILGYEPTKIDLNYIIAENIRMKKEIDDLRNMLDTSDERHRIIANLNNVASKRELTRLDQNRILKAIGW